jgi:thiamine transport system ATP-binding protein
VVSQGLEVTDAVVRYGSTTAVDEVSLSVGPGEVVALLGASGSGKSSLLRAVAGLEPLAGGSVCWDGVDLAATPVHRRGFVMMFQDGQLFPHLSVGELLDLVGLSGYQRRPVTALSGGQAQRVALARSLAPQPRLLLLDEPLSALDRGLREYLVGVLDDTLRLTGTPALYVTHDQDEAFALADRVAVLAGGRLLQLDTPGALWSRPASAEVADFLGYRPLLDAAEAARLGWDVGDGRLVGIGPGGLVPHPDGLEVPVLAARARRGGEFTVELPGGRQARVQSDRVPEHQHPPRTLRVRLAPDGCVLLPAPLPDGSRSRE